MPVDGERGHAVLMVGYDDATQRVIVRNSWGQVGGRVDTLQCRINMW